MLEKKMIKSSPIIQKFRHGLNLNTATTLLPRIRKRFNFCRMRKFRAEILHHVFDCSGHANAMPTICCLKALAGNFPTSKHWLNILAENGEIIGANNFKNLLGKLSSPLAVLRLS